ncbi:MAG: protoglobin domain-containing protein [Acidobacteriota bacterium]
MRHLLLPYDKLVFFQEQLGLGSEVPAKLAPYRHLFFSKRDEFANYFYDFCSQIPRTRIIIQHERTPGYLKQVWADWFVSLFTTELTDSTLIYMWKSGIRHVDVNIDQAYINLGYCMVRQFCHKNITAEIPAEERTEIQTLIDKLLDYCLLIETSAYVAASTGCDQEIIRGISHQIRNPITVIGGNAKRVQKRIGENDPLHPICNTIVTESRRLERLVTDIGVYVDLYQREPSYTVFPLTELISDTLAKLEPKESVSIRVDIDPDFPYIQGDVKDIETMFYYILENSLEAVSVDNPLISIASSSDGPESRYVKVEIFNTGVPPREDYLDNVFSPFYSSKPTGTGFGLPIARLAARKNLASILLVPMKGQGTKCIIHLPVPG